MATKSDFMAAEEMKAILDGRDKTEQERIIRWVTESLGLVATSSALPGNLPAATPVVSQTTAQHPHTSSPRSKDIKTFVNEKNPKNDVQFAAVVAYFYRFECPQADRKEVLVPKDLDDAGRLARGYSFTNSRTTLGNAVKLGYFDRAGNGSYKVNAVGENLVAMTLPSAGGGTNSDKHRQAKRKLRANKSKTK